MPSIPKAIKQYGIYEGIMKIYMALNEEGTAGDIGLHARMAVLSARNTANHDINILYMGERNDCTRWFENNGVRIIDSRVPYEHVIVELTHQGRYWTRSLGHWLRTNLCLEEKDDEYAVYTDVDVVFADKIDFSFLRPQVFCAAPEFQRDDWNYFNAGIMVANIPRLREDYSKFEEYLIENIKEHTYGFHDQIAYNIFYRGLWERLPIEFNWKPYWGRNDTAKIIHFHGPKPHAMKAILNGEWGWQSNHEIQIASLFVTFKDEYSHFLDQALRLSPGLDQADVDYLSEIREKIAKYDEKHEKIDLKFMNHKMFPMSSDDTGNLAFAKKATQSSVCERSRSQDSGEDASGGNNGIITGGYGFYTAREPNPWWQVDLENRFFIEKIVIFNSKEESDQLCYFSVLVSIDNIIWNEIYRKDDEIIFGNDILEPYTFCIDQKNSARYVRIRLDGIGCLHFNEIQVYGSPSVVASQGDYIESQQTRIDAGLFSRKRVRSIFSRVGLQNIWSRIGLRR